MGPLNYMKYKLFVGQSQLNQVSMAQCSTQSHDNEIHRRVMVPVS